MNNHNVLDADEFRISRHLQSKKIDDVSSFEDAEFGNKKNIEAREWARNANSCIITPTINETDLENDWIRFNSMPKKKRRESDWKSIELYRCTNQEHYERQKAFMLHSDIDKDIEEETTFRNIVSDIKPSNDDTFVDNNGCFVSESYIDIADSYYDSNPLNYTSLDIEKARNWASESNKVIIIPTRTLSELEDLWDLFNMMIKKHRRESDWMSSEIFGISNLRHYEYLKNQFLKEDIRNDDKETYGSVIESVSITKIKKYYSEAMKDSIPYTIKSLLEYVSANNGAYDQVMAANIVSDVLDRFDSDIIEPSDIVDTIICGDMPYLSPDEMIDMGIFGQSPSENYYGVLSDNTMINNSISVKEWFELYQNINKALYTEFGNYTSDWVAKVRELSYGLKSIVESGDEQKILARKQSLLELGWDPDIEFSTKARSIAVEMANIRMKSNFSNNKFKVVDLREFESRCENSNILHENVSSLKPVYVVLIEGKSCFSKAIKVLTKDIYSHIAISLDSSLHNMYSYGISSNSNKNGFRKEDINDLPIGGRIDVFAFFVTDPVYKKITKFIDNFKENADKTSYSFINLITYLFNIPHNTEWKLVCSQFVDRCLQAAEINLTGRDSSRVAPADLDRAMSSENRIYNLYKGLHSKYNSESIERLINALSGKAKPLKESNSKYYSNENAFITGIINNIDNVDSLLEMRNHIDIVKDKNIKSLLEKIVFDSISIKALGEAKEFPIQFDKDGNLFIKNLKKIDYESEYAKSHKLLKEYKKSNNYEGIKYELSKLWMMLCMIEDKLNSKKFNDLPSIACASSIEHKAKAKITNDFKYYLEEVIKNEPSFNFTEYYDTSPFSSAVTKINTSTLVFMSNIIKKFIKSI